MMGHWAFLSVGECIHPVSHMRSMDADEKDGSKKEIGDEWNGWWDEYERHDDKFNYDTEVQGLPDRIYFKETLPAELLNAGVKASQFPVTVTQ